MRVWFVVALFLAIVIFAASAGDSRFRLKNHQWKHRLLLVFASSASSANFLRQRALVELAQGGIEERDLLVVPIVKGQREKVLHEYIDTEAAATLRKTFGIESGEFTVVLVGKDGTEKMRSHTPLDPKEAFALIDTMPMRQNEIGRQSVP